MMAGKKILICEDDEGIAEVLVIILEESGFNVKLLRSGKGIERKVRQFAPDLLLLDIKMPGINGEEAIKLLKREEETAKIPIIVISALDHVEKVAKESGADGFLSKPFENSKLIRTIKKYL